MKFGTGYRPSPPEEVGLGHPQKLGAAPIPAHSYIELPPALDQGRSASCTGHATAVAIQEAMPRMPDGSFAELPSRLWLYYGGRAGIGETGQDAGAMIHSIFDHVRRMGVCPESMWPFSDQLADIVRQPDWTAIQAAADQKIVDGAYRISTVGRARCDDVARALGQGHTVVWGTLLDDAVFDLESNQDGVWPGVRGSILSGHAMLLHAHEPWEGGERRFLSRTSWGVDFGKEGSFWVSEAAVASANAADFWIVATSPAYSKEAA